MGRPLRLAFCRRLKWFEIGVELRWHVQQIYVSPVPVNDSKEPCCGVEFLKDHRIKVNGKQGSTLSVQKHGGWEKCFKIPKQVAMWS